VICGLSCDFAGRGSGRLLVRRAPALTVADPCIWHGCGTNLSRRQAATTVGAPTDQARVSLHPLPPQPRCRVLPASPSAASGVAHGSGGLVHFTEVRWSRGP
jgi:hypothetical protein